MSSYLYWQQAETEDAFYHFFTSEKLPTYPHAMRFENVYDLDRYIEAKESFIRSTKIPASCKACPIQDSCPRFYSGIICRKLWRKIWEYVK